MNIKNKNKNWLIFVIRYSLFIGGECDQAVIQGLKLLGSYNLITIGNLSTTTNVANRTLVCGSITSSSSATFASNANPPSPSNYTLEVNGQIVGGGSLNIL